MRPFLFVSRFGIFAPLRCAAWGAVLLGLGVFVWPVYAAIDSVKLQSKMAQRFGAAGLTNLNDWQRVMQESAGLPTADKLRQINDFFNRRIRFEDDSVIWKTSDYWATPLETLGKGAGDCEDFTIAKYLSLKNLGIPVAQMRLIYVKAKLGGPSSNISQAHMVLAYYDAPDAEPLVLDNLLGDIRVAGRRPDLTPVFSFNSEGLWLGAAGTDAAQTGGLNRLSRWQDLLQRARVEGID